LGEVKGRGDSVTSRDPAIRWELNKIALVRQQCRVVKLKNVHKNLLHEKRRTHKRDQQKGEREEEKYSFKHSRLERREKSRRTKSKVVYRLPTP